MTGRRLSYAQVGGIASGVALAIVLLSSCGHPNAIDVVSTPPASGVPSPATAARRLAQRMLAEAPVPKGAASSRSVPSVLAEPFMRPAVSTLIDLHRVWSVPSPSGSTYAYLQGHPPPGVSKNTIGEEGLAKTLAGSTQSLAWQLAEPGTDIQSATLLATVASDGAKRSWLRVDAQVVWYPKKNPAERVPTSAKVLTIEAETLGRPAKPVAAPVVVSNAAEVDKVARVIDHLPPAVPGGTSCPSATMQYRLSFSTSSGSHPGLVATEGICGFVGITLMGHPGQTLQDSHQQLLDAIGDITGTKPFSSSTATAGGG